MKGLPLALFVVALATAGVSAAQDMEAVLDLPGSRTDRLLSAEEVRAALGEALPTLEGCFLKTLRGTAVGEVTLELRIDNQGLPGSVQVDAPEAPRELVDCLIGVTEALRFDDHDGDPVEAAWPLLWQSNEQGARLLGYPVVFFRQRPRPLPMIVLPAGIGLDRAEALERALFGRPAAAPEEDPPADEETDTPEPAPEGTGQDTEDP